MYPVDRSEKNHPWHFKVMILALGMFCVFLGVLGLLLPIIPGILFLGVAVILLSRVSRRAERWRRKTPVIVRMERRVQMLGQLRWADRARACFWMGVGGVVSGFETAVAFGGRVLSRFAPNER